MNILIVNDDGIKAPGLEILINALQSYGNIYVSAPLSHQSGMSHAISIKDRIKAVTSHDYAVRNAIAVDGTPADATRLGIKLNDIDFDLVVSGINEGANIGSDILYSGTVAAAMEAKILGIPAIAISAPHTNVHYLKEETVKVFEYIIENKLYDGDGILNINFPDDSYAMPLGTKITKQGKRYYHGEYVKSERPDTYHIQFSLINYEEDPNSDVEAFERGYISITPITLDRTNYKWYSKLTK